MVLFSFLHHLLKVLWCYLEVLDQGAAEEKNNENSGTVFLAFAATEDSTIVSRLLPVPGIRFQGHWLIGHQNHGHANVLLARFSVTDLDSFIQMIRWMTKIITLILLLR